MKANGGCPKSDLFVLFVFFVVSPLKAELQKTQKMQENTERQDWLSCRSEFPDQLLDILFLFCRNRARILIN